MVGLRDFSVAHWNSSKPAMRIACSYRGRPGVHTTSEKEFVFGRAEAKFSIGLDLSPDPKVSRMHGRIWYEGRSWWLFQ